MWVEGSGRVWLVFLGGGMVGRFNVLRRSLSVSCGPMWVGCRGIDDVAPGIPRLPRMLGVVGCDGWG